MSDSTPSTTPVPPPLRQCSRCRLFFPTTASLSAAELKGWWLCDACTTSLTPSRAILPTEDAPDPESDPP